MYQNQTLVVKSVTPNLSRCCVTDTVFSEMSLKAPEEDEEHLGQQLPHDEGPALLCSPSLFVHVLLFVFMSQPLT